MGRGEGLQCIPTCMMYDTDQCHTPLNSLWVVVVLCVCGGGGMLGGGGPSVWWFVWVVLVALCSTCIQTILFRLICIM